MMPPGTLVRPQRLGLVGRARLIAEILVAYAEMSRALRRSDLPTMVAAARRTRGRLPDAPPPSVQLEQAWWVGRKVERVVAVLPTDRRCLIKSLVTARLLTRRSIPWTVVVGVAGDGGFAAHAWVEHAGRAVLPAGRFERLVEL